MLLLLLLDNNNLAGDAFNEGGVWPVLGVRACLQSVLRGAQTLVRGRRSCCCRGGGCEVDAGRVGVSQDPLALQGAEVAVVCVIAVKGRRVINGSSEDGGGRVEGGRGGGRGAAGRRGGSEETTAGGGAARGDRLARLLLLLLLLVRGSNLRQRPQFGLGCGGLGGPRWGSAVRAGRSRFVGRAADEAPDQILPLAVELLEVMEVVVVMVVQVVVVRQVVLVVVAEDRSFHSRERRRGDDGLGRELQGPRLVSAFVTVLGAFVVGLIGALLASLAAHLLPVRLGRARMVRQRIHVKADTWQKEEEGNYYY